MIKKREEVKSEFAGSFGNEAFKFIDPAARSRRVDKAVGKSPHRHTLGQASPPGLRVALNRSIRLLARCIAARLNIFERQ